MIHKDLREFADNACEAGMIGVEDVKRLSEIVLADGLGSREEADVLIALDRSVRRADEAAARAWAELFSAVLVDFAVWGASPTGYVDAATARWLVTAINACGGPTENARRAVAQMVREAQRVDETLLVFVMRRGVMRLRDVIEADPGTAAKVARTTKSADAAA